MAQPKRIFRGLDAHSPWATRTRCLQIARRLKDKEIPEPYLVRALEVLAMGKPDDIVDALFVQCPLCKEQFSAQEATLGPFIWNIEAAQHYLLQHHIWPKELDELLTWAAMNPVP